MIVPPKNWLVATLGQVCSKIVDGSHNPPRKREAGLPMLSARNIENGNIRWDDYRLIDPADFERENRRTYIEAGDVLVTIVGSIGRSAVVPQRTAAFTLQRSVAVLRAPDVEPEFLSFQIRAPDFQKRLALEARGTAQKGVYLKTLASLQVVIAPIQTQRAIVEAVSSYFSRLDDAASTAGRLAYDVGGRMSGKTESLKQGILRWAFEGTLVDPALDVQHPTSLLQAIEGGASRRRTNRSGSNR